MAPSPQEGDDHRVQDLAGEKVVISGVSGLYPSARHVKALSEILYEKKDPITSENRRWDFKHPELADHIGMVPELDRFDSQFFKLSQRFGSTMDVMSRKLLEQTYQAIYDAGLSPEHINGKNIGVYVGACFSETEKACFYTDAKVGSGLVGCSKSMFANRISYWLDLKGPSYALDQSCCSAVAVLEAAHRAIQRGECEAAIVGAGSLCMHPQTMIHYGRIMALSPDGKTRSFCEDANGCVKSEAVTVLFLQKAKDALRIYADVVHVKSTFSPILEGENGPKYGFYRDSALLASYLKEFYKKAKVSPNAVEYVEGFGTGTPEVDKAELNAFEEVFCKNKCEPLIVGNVMSNIGYTEAASGIASITKVLLAYQKGIIAANLHCENPRKDIRAIRDNRMVIASDHQPITRSYVAINSMSYNGINAHVLLHGHYKSKNLLPYKSVLPRLVTISGRHENAVKRIFDDLKSRPIDPEELALLDNIHKKRIAGHLGRGYAIFDTTENEAKCVEDKIEHFDDDKRPLWFVYSGMGSQWNKMGTELMKIPVFAAAIECCHNILKPNGIDLINILTTENKTIFDNILHAFVGITSVQIGLTDVLKEIGIEPDNIIGHSVGEVGCAYADGSFTAEQAILASYARGKVSTEIPVIKGSMAAVGLGYQQVKDMCPDDIMVACHNGPDSSTLSGPADSMKEFVAKLTAQGIFAKEVKTCNIAYHSKYIQDMGEPHLKYLHEIIPKPAVRSKRWISSSIPQNMWDEDLAKYCSAEYHNNNLTNPVLFEESLRLVPSNAVLIEIAPHGLLQAILKRSLSPDCRHIPLTRRGHNDNAIHVLNAIGRLYMEGYNPHVGNLYPKVEFPVSTETPSLSHLVEWTHDEKWNLPLYISGEKRMASATKHLITLHDEEFMYLRGNVIRGRVVYPFAAALVAAWDTLAMSLGVEKKKLSVHFRDVHLFAQPILHQQKLLRLNVILHRGTGKFEISGDGSKVATGYIIGNLTDLTLPKTKFESMEPLDLQSNNVYEMLHERDYLYKDDFRTIYKVNTSLTEAQLLWNDNWITFIDGILQLNALRHQHTTVVQPTYIRRICIDVDDHVTKIEDSGDKKVFTAYVSDVHDFTRCGGIILDNIKFYKLPPAVEDSVNLNIKKFLPFFHTDSINISTALQVFLEIIIDNLNKENINGAGVTNKDSNIFNAFKEVISQKTNIKYSDLSAEEMGNNLSDIDLVLVSDLSAHESVLKKLYNSLPSEAFVINFKPKTDSNNTNERPSALYRILSLMNTSEVLLELIKIGPKQLDFATVVTISSEADVLMLNSKLKDLPLHKGLLVVAIAPIVPGLKDQIKKWRKNIKGSKIAMVMIDRNMSGDETLDQVPELAFSQLKNGTWGGEYTLPFEETTTRDHVIILQSTRIGDLESLKWVEAPEPRGASVIVNIHYAGLNDCDIKRATGVIPFKEGQDFVYGMDFSGETKSGSRVMGIVSNGAVGSKVLSRPELLWEVPADWSLENAATVPLAYSMAFYCLNIKAHISHGMTILILGGTGALGQAAISIALAHGCHVFTTVSDNNKKQLLLKLFPSLEEKNIGYSREALFGDMVLRATKGEGCDIVLCCATGELKNISLNCCAFSGITIDTVQVHSKEKFAFGLHHLTKQRSYVTVDFSSIFTRNRVDDMEVIKDLVSKGIAEGYVKPLTHTTFGPKDVVAAFKHLESIRRNGRVLIRLCDPVPEALSRSTCSPDRWQLVFCDNTLGIQLAEKLIAHGARKLHLNCSTQTGYLQYKIRSWNKLGVEINMSSKDFIDSVLIESLLKETTSKGHIEGIYTIMTNSATKYFDSSINKLNEISKKICSSLKYFVVVCYDEKFGDEIYSNRTQENLPTTIIHLPPLNKIDAKKNSNSISNSAVIAAIVKILASPTANVFVNPKEEKRSSLLKELATIAGIRTPNNPEEYKSLEDSGFPDDKMQSIKAYLRDVYNTYFEENIIPSLTVQMIHEIEKSSRWSRFEDKKELNVFYSNIDSDEVLASAPTVIMKTRAKYSREQEFDAEKTSLCIIPGFEGNHERFQLLCERLKLPAFVLQPGYQKHQESIQDMAQRFYQTLTKKMKIKDDFYLLGYESGVSLALETAKLLEKDGRKGTIFCVGQTPEELQNNIEDFTKTLNQNNSSLEDAVANHMVNLIKGDNNAFTKIESEVSNAQSWQDKLEICVEEVAGHNGHTTQFIRAVIDAAVTRIQQYKAYQNEPFELQSKIVLLHTASTFPPITMQIYSKQPIAIHELDTPLGNVTQDLRVSTLINQHLSADVLELFEENHLCETYLFNGNTFLFVSCPE